MDITLTTDFGTRDGFVAQMKGVILGINPSARLIDVTHDIRPFAVLEGALVLKGIARYFPIGTIHVAVVDPGVGSNRRCIAVSAEGRIYVGPDNGLVSLVMSPAAKVEVREIRNPEFMLPEVHPSFHGRDIFAAVAAHLSLGTPIHLVGPLVDDPVRLAIPAVLRTTEGLQGEVIYSDRFGNLSTNVEANMLDRSVQEIVCGDVRLPGIKRYFQEVPEGTPLALLNSFGLLEIAVNRGDASAILGIRIGDRVAVTWEHLD
ncbi:MAG: SAM-dependent chlorinase/fluorinase [Desulfomonile tiedjei]|nr:SAM-dependent chlorinase/fluorinase [Desulfomonile tiedjei]